ncbi:PulJ/GspJ family protein [Pararhizobium gei]|uniref:PulJ/GspJ family protein n=1 Tax=Pararhizobium gei TaxID=1395951 RepID=UPI0023DBFD0E|nr:prepilin-type N-terminal cleavage/methylation domain-containing protein [Rhizobium gei]
MATDDHDESGFTLLEVLIAFVILSAALVAAHQSLSSSFGALAAAESARNAALLAEEILARNDITQPEHAKNDGRGENGLRPTVRVEPVNLGAAFGDVIVERLIVEIVSASGKSAGRYVTFRVAPVAAVRDDR